MVSLPDDSILLCGGIDNIPGSANVVGGDGLFAESLFSDCWRSWDFGYHWDHVITDRGDFDVLGQGSEFGLHTMTHVGGGRVVIAGGRSQLAFGHYLGVHASTLCLQRRPEPFVLPDRLHSDTLNQLARPQARRWPLLCPPKASRGTTGCLLPMKPSSEKLSKFVVEIASVANPLVTHWSLENDVTRLMVSDAVHLADPRSQDFTSDSFVAPLASPDDGGLPGFRDTIGGNPMHLFKHTRLFPAEEKLAG